MLVAVEDCEIIVLDPHVAGAVISRSPALTTALEQIESSRRRRLVRVLRRLERDRAEFSIAALGPGAVSGAAADAPTTADAEPVDAEPQDERAPGPEGAEEDS
jgi:hypothetical protein